LVFVFGVPLLVYEFIEGHKRPPDLRKAGSLTLIVIGLLLYVTASTPKSAVDLARASYVKAQKDAVKMHGSSTDLMKALNSTDVSMADDSISDSLAILLNATRQLDEEAEMAAEKAADAIAEDEFRVANKEKMVTKTEIAKAGADAAGEKKTTSKQEAAHTEALKDLEKAKQAAIEGVRLKQETFRAWVDAVNTTANTAEELVSASEQMVSRVDERIEHLQQVMERLQADKLKLTADVKLAVEQATKMRARANTAEADGLPGSASGSAAASDTKNDVPPSKDEP